MLGVGEFAPVLFLHFCRGVFISALPTLSFFVLDDLLEVARADPPKTCLLARRVHFLHQSHRFEHIDYVVESANLGLGQR